VARAIKMRATLPLLRRARRLSLEDVAAKVGASATTVCRWERGLSMPPSPAAERYADVLGISQRQLNRLLVKARDERSAMRRAAAPEADADAPVAL
jgi:transcriptional regulator with XRE-family HTH domain